MEENQQKKDGISLRTIHIWLIIGAIIISSLMFYSTFHLSTSFRHLTESSEQQISLRQDALELMDASDFLTERVQRFTVNGDRRFMDDYFTEVFESHHREEALASMSEELGESDALARLKKAMDSSVELMDIEYYAMKLVAEAKDFTEMPQQLASVTLSAEDQALSSEAKMQRATEIVLSDEYYGLKDQVRLGMRQSLDELETMVYETNAEALLSLRKEMIFLRIVIALQILVICVMVFLTSRLGIHPVLAAVERIKSDSPIPEVGANEFRYLARAYNKMYEVYRNSLERLNFKASHDELTGAYNRSGYELLLSSLDLQTTYMILFDVDNFKTINDTYGHETGDRVLMKLVSVLKNNFRSDDYVCRIGGDEFVVFMVHSTKEQRNLLAAKLEEINRELKEAMDGLPETSISVGIVHGSEASDPAVMFDKADKAMYRAKQSGKNTYVFTSA